MPSQFLLFQLPKVAFFLSLSLECEKNEEKRCASSGDERDPFIKQINRIVNDAKKGGEGRFSGWQHLFWEFLEICVIIFLVCQFNSVSREKSRQFVLSGSGSLSLADRYTSCCCTVRFICSSEKHFISQWRRRTLYFCEDWGGSAPLCAYPNLPESDISRYSTYSSSIVRPWICFPPANTI